VKNLYLAIQFILTVGAVSVRGAVIILGSFYGGRVVYIGIGHKAGNGLLLAMHIIKFYVIALCKARLEEILQTCKFEQPFCRPGIDLFDRGVAGGQGVIFGSIKLVHLYPGPAGCNGIIGNILNNNPAVAYGSSGEKGLSCRQL